MCMERQERKEKKILTENRLSTVNKRETSFEGLAAQFENGEVGVYTLIAADKNQIFKPKVSITKKDLEEIPCLAQLREAIDMWEERLKTAEGREAYIIKRTIIDLRKDQYIIKNAYRRPITPIGVSHTSNPVQLLGEECLGKDGQPISNGISLLNPSVCSGILCNYSRLKQDSYGHFDTETWYLITDFEKLCDKALADYPMYMRIVEYKIDGLSNLDIQLKIQQEFGIKHSSEYISSLWRNKIPAMIADAAQEEWLTWYFTEVERGKYKRCSRCGEIKLANNRYFSKNKTSKDSFYSICKCCRNKKHRQGQE